MIDLHAHFRRKRQAVDYDELMKILEKDKVVVERGDIVCLHTGFAEMVMEFKKNPTPEALHNTCTGLDGRDDKLLQWITDSGLSVLAADNYAVELFNAAPWKSTTHAMLPLHQHCLFKNGIHLGELWYFTPLAGWLREHKRNRYRFRFRHRRRNRHRTFEARLERVDQLLEKRRQGEGGCREVQGCAARPGRRRRGRRLPQARQGGARQMGPRGCAGQQCWHHQVRQARR